MVSPMQKIERVRYCNFEVEGRQTSRKPYITRYWAVESDARPSINKSMSILHINKTHPDSEMEGKRREGAGSGETQGNH